MLWNNGKTCCQKLMSVTLKLFMGNAFLWKQGSKDTEVFKAGRNKLFASNEKQIDNHTLFTWHALFKHVSCVYLPL